MKIEFNGNSVEVERLNTENLDGVIKLYQDKEFEVTEDLSNNKKRKAEIARLIATYGAPHTVTEVDKEYNPELSVEVGDVIFLTGDNTLNGPVTTPLESDDEDDTTDSEEEASEEDVAPKAPVVDEDQLYYQGKPVIKVENKIMHGKLYKYVIMGATTHLLSPEEFESQVKKIN